MDSPAKKEEDSLKKKMGNVNGHNHQESNMLSPKQLDTIINRKFNTFGKQSRFVYPKTNNKLGPGSYNEYTHLNITSKVNSSHHIFNYPVIGYPLKNKDQCYSVCNGLVVKDDRFSSLKFKRQQARTFRETKVVKHEMPGKLTDLDVMQPLSSSA